MKKQDLKSRITEAFESEMPDLRSRMLASCEREAQLPVSTPQTQAVEMPARRINYNVVLRRVAACAICIMLFVSGLLIGLLVPRTDETVPPAEAEAFVYLDVNPSIELRMDDENKILECLAINEDAQAILSGLKLDGVDMNTALTALAGSMYVNGYLTEDSNSILISVDAKDDEKVSELLVDITGKINTVFENSALECSVIAQSVKVSDDLKQRAEENGVSVGKMHFIDKMVGEMDGFNSEDVPELINMSIKDLDSMYSSWPNEDGKNDPSDDGEKDPSDGNDSTADDGGSLSQGIALMLLFATLDVEPSEIEWHEIQRKQSDGQGNGLPVYTVSLKIRGDDTVYEYEVDCQTGRVTGADGDVSNGKINQNDDEEVE